jgi:N-acetylglucosaminyl-diphospho-decaprenol L-rhamnosyltransferase
MPSIEVSYCVVNTSQRDLLVHGLDAIARERERLPFATEVLVLDNGSRDGSAEAARGHPALAAQASSSLPAQASSSLPAQAHSSLPGQAHSSLAPHATEQAAGEVIAIGERRGKGLNDSELLAGATMALREALERHRDAACAGAKLVRPGGAPQACAWRFPTPLTALAGALFLHRLLVVQSKGEHTKEADWCQSSALLVRREAAAQVDYLDPAFFVYSDEVDFAKRLRDAGWRSLYVPSAVVIHHEQLSTAAVSEPRIVELARNRDLYMRKHHSAASARAVRWLTAWSYAVRAFLALGAPGHSPKRYWRHVTATLWPGRGGGLRESADAYNRASS